MGRDDWFRNSDWNGDIEAAFRAKLSRSRSSRPQYLEIQAGYLTESHPTVALRLIEEYFKTGDEFVVPGAFCVQGQAYLSLGKIEEAVGAYKRALDWEIEHPGLVTNARIALPRLIADLRLTDEYEYALNILTTRFNKSDHSWPLTRYLWNGSSALIASDLGQHADAKDLAERALRAAAQTESPFRYHRDIGLVENTSDEFGRRLKRIARPSKLRSLFRLVSGRVL